MIAYQPDAFTLDTPDDLPPELLEIIPHADAIAISTSGGKDSQALLNYVLRLRDRHGWKGECFAIHADLGSVEWPGTRLHIERQCAAAGIPLVVVRNPKGMVGVWRSRFETLLAQGNTKPFWSSSQMRYCTAQTKIQPIDKYLRRYRFPVCFVGIRGQESTGRAQKPMYTVRNEITTDALNYKGKGGRRSRENHAITAFAQWPAVQRGARVGSVCRFALTVNPLIDWGIDQVWRECGTSLEDLTRRRNLFLMGDYEAAFSGFPGHWAYVAGNSRLSCALCVMASQADLLNGARLNPSVWNELVALERESGWAFQHGKPLAALARGVDRFGELGAIVETLIRLDLIRK